MKKRLFSLVGTKYRIKSASFVCALSVIIGSVMPVFASGDSPKAAEKYIGKSKAKSIALEHAGISESDVVFIKSRLDYDDGRVVYDVEFYSGTTEYDYEIDALSGDVLEHDREIEHYTIPKKSVKKTASKKSVQKAADITAKQYIGKAKAKSIALSDAELTEDRVRRIKVKLEREDGAMIYEVEFSSGRTEYEFEIDAISGTILKSDVDFDD